MRTVYLVSVTLHVLAALAWLGGLFFLGLVGAPILRRVQPPELRQRLFHDLGVRFRSVGWGAITLLVATGITNLHFRGWLQWDAVLGNATFWRTAVGTALAVKLVAVTVMIVLSAIHDFWLGPAAGQQPPGSDEALAFRRRAAWIARINALVGLILVIAAVRLVR